VAETSSPRPRTSLLDHGASAEHASQEDGDGRRWLIGVWAVVVVFGALTAAWSHHVGVPLRDPGGKMFSGRLTGAVLLFGGLVVVDAAVRTGWRGWTVRRAVGVLRTKWSTERLVLALSGLLAYHLVYVCYRNLKSWDAFNKPLDDELNRLEAWLFFGNSPASLLHDLLGQGVAAPVLSVVYSSFSHLVVLSVVGALVFVDRIRDGYVFLASSMWLWILGVGSYYLIPSLGPFATAPQDFDQLPHTTMTVWWARLLSDRAEFLANPDAPGTFASVSAFASLHCGFTAMVVLMLRFYGLRRLAAVVAVYLAATMVATVYFGWHFVIDLPGGILVAVLAVCLGRWTIYAHGRTAQREEVGKAI
jgi:PAP2 superfamily